MMQKNLLILYLSLSNFTSLHFRKSWVNVMCFSRGGDG
jgi:hypothetical protein